MRRASRRRSSLRAAYPLPRRSPYFGQAGWFILFAKEKIPTAIERYQKEILRVLGVLESVLSKRRWLVGDKCTVADLSFIQCVDTLYTIVRRFLTFCRRWNTFAVKRFVAEYNGFDFANDFPDVFK